MRCLSLGWGTQSFTLAAMVALGELPPIDAAIHADTTHDGERTEAFRARWTPWLEERGVRVVTVRAVNTEPVAPRRHTVGVEIPAYTRDEGRGGQVRRQCTNRWKIVPLRHWLSEELARRGERKQPGSVELWIGITTDEAIRMKDADVQWLTHRWPLIDRNLTRADCLTWLDRHGLERPPKSACVFCPYHNQQAWKELRSRGGEDWQKAVRVDEAIRNQRPPDPLYVHPARRPLAELDLRTLEDLGQMSLWGNECEGVCGV